jgi:magnesium-transporting ATPase (P-type)
MIQRIQSIWLLAAAVAAFATFKLSFFSGNIQDATGAKQFVSLVATTNIFLLVLTVAVAVASLVTVFLYKDRKRQLLITIATAVVSLICILLDFVETKKFVEGKIDLTSIVSFIMPVFLLLAARGIWKDQKLVKSVDRLR